MKMIPIEARVFATADLKPSSKSWGPIKILDDGRLAVKHGPATRKASIIFPPMLLDAVIKLAAKDEAFRLAVVEALTAPADAGAPAPEMPAENTEAEAR